MSGPAFESGLHRDDAGSIVGCWLRDVRDLLRHDPVAGSRDSVFREIRRKGATALVHRTRERTTQKAAGSVPAVDSVQYLIRTLAHAWAAVEAAGQGTPPDALRVPPGTRRPDLPLVAMPEAVADLRAALYVLTPFVDTLDPGAVRLVVAGYLHRGDPSSYALLDPTFDPEAPLAAALRMQPLWPKVLARLSRREPAALAEAVRKGSEALLGLTRDWMSRQLRGGRTSADAALRLQRGLVGLDEEEDRAVRRAADLMDASGAERDLELGCRLALGMASLPASWTPRGTQAWTAFAACAPAVLEASARAARDDAATFLDAKGDWSRFATRLEAAHGLGPRGLARAVRDVDDMVRAYDRQVLAPALALASPLGPRIRVLDRYGPPDASRGLLTAGRRMCRVLEASRRWHAAEDRIRAVAAAFPLPEVPDHWPRAWPTLRHGDVEVRELLTVWDLVAEGARGKDADGLQGLSHCVGGYAGSCLTGESRILALRRVGTGSLVRLSTAEVRVRHASHGLAIDVVQHRGHSNSTPPPEARSALERLVHEVSTGRMPLDLVAMGPVPGAYGPTGGAGYDHTAPGAWESVRAAWDPFVPRRLRGLAAERLGEAAGFHGDGLWKPLAPMPSKGADALATTPGPVHDDRGARS